MNEDFVTIARAKGVPERMVRTQPRRAERLPADASR